MFRLPCVLTAFLALAMSVAHTPAVALVRGPAVTASAWHIEVENRFLPGFLRRGEDGAAASAREDALRIGQLEEQVRRLTGQVEELSYAVRQLQAAAAGNQDLAPAQPPNAADPASIAPPAATPGPGAAPAPLGLPQDGAAAEPAPAPSNDDGPLDLSALNRSLGGSTFDAAPGARTPAAVAPAQEAPAQEAPAVPSELADIRALQESGRYGLAAQSARQLLNVNPAPEVAGEARYLLGEALLAQGDYRSAANYFLENYTSNPDGPRAPASLLRLGTALNGLGEREAACSSLEELFGAYPDIDASIRAEAERERRAANCT